MKLPDGWKEVKLGNITKISSGGTPSKENKAFWGDGYPWISAKDLKQPIVTDSIDKLTREGYRKANVASKGSLLILTRGMTLHNDVPICIAGKDVAFNQDVKCLSVIDEIDVQYLSYFLKGKKRELLKLVDSAGNGTGRLDTELLKSVAVFYPPLPEQKAIADTLSVWDSMIEKTERLVIKKEKLFTFVQKALFSSISNNHKKLLKTIADITKGTQLGKVDMIPRGRYQVINGGVSASGYTDSWNTDENTITISEGGNSCGFINFITENFWAGGHCYTLSIKNTEQVSKEFLYWFLKVNENKIMKLRVGSGLPNIQRKDLEQLEIPVCPSEEQISIVQTLEVAQHEIDLLRQLTDQYKLQKQGLMQKLLTGQWRIK
ncbi:MAG: restriction endonuclease subunit S [Treponema sp.]|nr:restriction endonuclease subunit S [Treponema sp.]